MREAREDQHKKFPVSEASVLTRGATCGPGCDVQQVAAGMHTQHGPRNEGKLGLMQSHSNTHLRSWTKYSRSNTETHFAASCLRAQPFKQILGGHGWRADLGPATSEHEHSQHLTEKIYNDIPYIFCCALVSQEQRGNKMSFLDLPILLHSILSGRNSDAAEDGPDISRGTLGLL